MGVIGIIFAFSFIFIAIMLSPWFSWEYSALSDLGHSVRSEVAPIFNLGLLTSGFLIIYYSLTNFKNHAKYTSYLLILTGLSLQLVGAFDEVYKTVHFAFSVLFFTFLGLTSISYIIEKKSKIAIVALIVVLTIWGLYGLKIFSMGIAVPEAISSIATATWILKSAIKKLL